MQQQQHRIEQHGTIVYMENWIQHTNDADIVRDVGQAYREIGGGRDHDTVCPVCRDYGRGNLVDTIFYINQRYPQRHPNARGDKCT